MKKKQIALKNLAILTLLISSFIACDKDFASIDSDIINNDNAVHFKAAKQKFNVVAYTKKLDPVQTSNLPLNFLGTYYDPVYGTTTANVVSQISTTIFNRVFGNNVKMDSVVLHIPYFSRSISVNDSGKTIYELDSVFGTDPIKLSIYENNYFLRDFNPSSEINSTQTYYSNGSTGLDQINTTQLEGTLIKIAGTPNGVLENFVPNDSEIQIKNTSGEITERLAPALRVKLDTTFWRQKIIAKEGSIELSNLNNFKDYFRGIYFKTEAVNGNGNLSLLNFAGANAKITMYYDIESSTQAGVREKNTYEFTFTGNRFNLISEPSNPITNGDAVNGDEKLYLKGGQGSVAIIDLFSGLIQDPDSGLDVPQLDYFRNRKGKWLINEANLVFYVDQTAVQQLTEPDRVYLYDLENNTPLPDYFVDLVNSTVPVNSRISHLGKLQRVDNEPDGRGIKYKIRLTEHINNILLRDSTNVKLGLAVSANVNIESSSLQYRLLTSDNLNTKVPLSSIVTPRGTVLHGNNTSIEAKKLYLEILYTEPNN
ncbi:DUF4270 domain-containing protein [Geojedonia litorea]|uniref:DUF4270 domain-containing protein n=1 Tax=Geojedonia litorea TaxID=1268269 RepID=A0ABV9N476_9FLAO